MLRTGQGTTILLHSKTIKLQNNTNAVNKNQQINSQIVITIININNGHNKSIFITQLEATTDNTNW